MMTDWYQKSINTLSLNGKGERTQEAYTRALRMLVKFYDKSPEDITEQELEDYFLRRKNVDHWSPNTMRICYCGIRFYFVQVLQRNWHLFDILRAKSESRLPAVLSREEVRALTWLCAHRPQPGVPLHRLRLRPAAAGSAVPGSLRHRQPAHDAPRASWQGRQGPLRAAAARDPRHPARPLAQPP